MPLIGSNPIVNLISQPGEDPLLYSYFVLSAVRIYMTLQIVILEDGTLIYVKSMPSLCDV